MINSKIAIFYLTTVIAFALALPAFAAPGNTPTFAQVTGQHSTVGNLVMPFIGSAQCSYRVSISDGANGASRKFTLLHTVASASGNAIGFSTPLAQSDLMWLRSKNTIVTLVTPASNITSPTEYPATLRVDLSSPTIPMQARLSIESSLGWYSVWPGAAYLESDCDIPNAVQLAVPPTSTTTTTITIRTSTTTTTIRPTTTTTRTTTTTTTIKPTTTTVRPTTSTTTTRTSTTTTSTVRLS
jgi:hypothetical protein